MSYKPSNLFLLFSVLFLMSGTCKNSTATSTADNSSTNTLRKLFEQYREGEISECKFEGKKVYSAGLNAPDAGTEIYDEAGTKIGGCYYSTRQLHPACDKLTDCEVIYRSENHITGQPAIDKYQLKQ